jgi:hypothetical protein
MELTDTEREANRNAYAGRVAILKDQASTLKANLGRRGTRMVLRVLQFSGIFPRA